MICLLVCVYRWILMLWKFMGVIIVFIIFSFGIVIVIIVGVWVSYCLHETIWLIERFVGLVMHAWHLDEERVW